jgi:chemosensory pili system protein ChpA (sensor histidine kinase/response regulator)
LADSAHAIRRTVAALQAASPRIPVFAELSAQLASLRDSLPEARLAAVTVDDSAQSTYAEAMPSIEPPVSPGDVELAVHDLSAYVGHEEPGVTMPGTMDSPEGLEAKAIEAATTADPSSDELTFDDREVAFETEEAKPEPAVTFFDMELTYAAIAPTVEAPVAETAGDAVAGEAIEATLAEEAVDDAASSDEALAETAASESEYSALGTAQDEIAAIEAGAGEESFAEEAAIEQPVLEEQAIEASDQEDQVVEDEAVEPPAAQRRPRAGKALDILDLGCELGTVEGLRDGQAVDLVVVDDEDLQILRHSVLPTPTRRG